MLDSLGAVAINVEGDVFARNGGDACYLLRSGVLLLVKSDSGIPGTTS